ncbi:MAG: helix-turn-helix domain-containing protein [Oliverpabstia sp.]
MLSKIQYLKNFFQGTFLPLHYYKDKCCQLMLPAMDPCWDLTNVYIQTLRNTGKEIAYILSQTFLYYGIVQNLNTDEYLIVGPVTSTRLDKRAMTNILAESSISTEYLEKVWNFFQMSPVFSYEQFIHLLALLYEKMTGTCIDPDAYFIDQNHKSWQSVTQKHSDQMYQAKEEENFHNTYYFERELYQYVTDGNLAGLENMLKQTQALIAGKIGENSLRQEKNVFIASTTLLTRAAIAGGLDIETAYQLSDAYIQESEKAFTSDSIARLSTTVLFDFTKRVAACKIPKGMSTDIYNCIQFISTHTNQPISVEDVADAVGKSRSYISRKFKSELGFNLNDFIMRKKLEEGKSLLAFTDKPISEISEYLCFSSQSYFQNVFKKKYHMTPYEFRKKSQH